MQRFYFVRGEDIVIRHLPDAHAEILPGVYWGRVDELFTVAYWRGLYWMHEADSLSAHHRIGDTFKEEVVACMLGGYGVRAEVALAAFKRLRGRGLLAGSVPTEGEVSSCLREPLDVFGRKVSYRFWRRKSKQVADALSYLRSNPPVSSGRALRKQLLELPGIGLKTASWIVRNWEGSSEVAILDIHVVRAGRLMGLFAAQERTVSAYMSMEARFLELATRMSVSAAHLDSLIWRTMRASPRFITRVLRSHTTSPLEICASGPSNPSKASSEAPERQVRQE